ncbi:hypothetical protein BCR44DRAFT_1444091, partial [Catenaria anguillulae PL171]
MVPCQAPRRQPCVFRARWKQTHFPPRPHQIRLSSRLCQRFRPWMLMPSCPCPSLTFRSKCFSTCTRMFCTFLADPHHFQSHTCRRLVFSVSSNRTRKSAQEHMCPSLAPCRAPPSACASAFRRARRRLRTRVLIILDLFQHGTMQSAEVTALDRKSNAITPTTLDSCDTLPHRCCLTRWPMPRSTRALHTQGHGAPRLVGPRSIWY